MMSRNLSLLSLLFLTFPLSVGFASPKTEEGGEDWRWVWAVMAAVVVIWVVSWWLNREQRCRSEEVRAPQAPEPPESMKTVSAPESPAEPDDLKVIEGIGPKIAGILQEAGIQTFDDLASADVERLREILEQAGPRYRLADPGTWPEQAALAAAGKWEELEKLQDELKGGRKV